MKFIGEDGSMGLRRGQIYNVQISSKGEYIWVDWGFCKMCSYESPESLAKNWAKL